MTIVVGSLNCLDQLCNGQLTGTSKNFILRAGSVITTGSNTHKKQLRICIEYTYISEFMLWLHRGKFVNVKQVKIPSLGALQVATYLKTVK